MYANSKTIDSSFEDAQVRVTEALQKEGFGVLTEIDVKATMKKKLDVDFRNYKILGACNSPFAYKALTMEENIGVLMPCNVAIQEVEPGKIRVSVVNPMESMKAAGNESLAEIAVGVSDMLLRVLDSL
ncbi:MAG: DUF302 domain-containing protein [Ignavibacteriaceae bacterium]